MCLALRVAIVDDEQSCRDQLKDYIGRFSKQWQVEFEVTSFSIGTDIVEHYRPGWDIILLDIRMAGIDGMEAARRIRSLDEDVVLIFITNMVQYALKGYEVNAYDFVVKPLTYPAFAMKFQKITRWLERRREKYIVLSVPNGMRRESVSDVYYIEVSNHRLLCHTVGGVYPLVSGTLTALEKQLNDPGFYRCNNCYLVNMRHVTGIGGDTVRVGGDELAVSRARKKGFLAALTQFVGGI